jgi:hypothetical protein
MKLYSVLYSENGNKLPFDLRKCALWLFSFGLFAKFVKSLPDAFLLLMFGKNVDCEMKLRQNSFKDLFAMKGDEFKLF